MGSYNHLFANHFGSCRLLAYARDIYRERDVRLYLLPGEWDAVGVTDGTDAWIAPVVQGREYFHSVDVWQLLADLREGKSLPPPQPIVVKVRRRLALDEEPQTVARRRHVEV